MPGVLYRNLNIVLLSIKTLGDFYLFYDFPYIQILMLFMRYLGTLDIANSHNYATLKRIKIFRKYTQLLLFNDNVQAKAYSFIFKEDI